MNWFLPKEGSRFGMMTAQSGCASKRRLFLLIISGSTQIPNSMSISWILFARRVIPAGSFFVFTNQSPRLDLSLSRWPNHPSSRTKSSTPSSLADLASSTILLSEKLK